MGEPYLPATTTTHGIFFELDRFERAGEHRLELSGRWYGIRGRRFVRPTLTLSSGAENMRALADLEHKPWAVEEGEHWEAAFPIEVGEVDGAQLAVAPDITVRLPTPGGNGGASRRLEVAPKNRPKLASRLRSRRGPTPDLSALATPKPAEPLRELESARREIDCLRAERDQVRDSLERSRAAHAEIQAAFQKRNAVISQLRDALSTRLEEDRNNARRGPDSERALADREAALREQEMAAARRGRDLDERALQCDRRERALAARRAGVEEQERALAARRAEVEQRERALAQRDLALEERSADAPVRTPVSLESDPGLHPGWVTWVQRACAVAFLLAPVVAVGLLTKLI